MEKKILKKCIFETCKRVSGISNVENFNWGEIKKLLKEENIELQDEDILTCAFEEGFEYTDNSCDPQFVVRVERPELESDEAFEKRIKEHEDMLYELKKRRKETYLKLKKEFEDE